MDQKPHQPGQAPPIEYPDRDLKELISPQLAHYLDYHMTWEEHKRFMACIMKRYSAMAVVLKEIDIHVPDRVIDSCYTPLYMEVLEDIHIMGEMLEIT